MVALLEPVCPVEVIVPVLPVVPLLAVEETILIVLVRVVHLRVPAVQAAVLVVEGTTPIPPTALGINLFFFYISFFNKPSTFIYPKTFLLEEV